MTVFLDALLYSILSFVPKISVYPFTFVLKKQPLSKLALMHNLNSLNCYLNININISFVTNLSLTQNSITVTLWSILSFIYYIILILWTFVRKNWYSPFIPNNLLSDIPISNHFDAANPFKNIFFQPLALLILFLIKLILSIILICFVMLIFQSMILPQDLFSTILFL